MKAGTKDGCCKDEQKHFKLDTDHQKADVALLVKILLSPSETATTTYFSAPTYIKIAESFPITHAPPNRSTQRLHVLYNVFLI